MVRPLRHESTILIATEAATKSEAERPMLEELGARNGRWFDTEMDKLDRWAQDRRATLKAELSELDDKLKEGKKAARFAPSFLKSRSASAM